MHGPAARQCVFLVPGDPLARTGGTLYDQQIAQGLRARGWQVDWRTPGEGFPFPDAVAQARAAALLDALPERTLVVADGLAFGALAGLAERHAARLRWVALVHHPLALEAGLSSAQQDALRASERRALACASQVVVTSASTAAALAAYAVPPERIAVVEPGTARASWSTGGAAGPGALALLCVASVTPRKGHAVLLQALAALRGSAWQLHCAGSLQRDAATAAAAQALAQRLGIAERVRWHGELAPADLAALYAGADLFVLPSLHEGYGMALAEALAHGLPVVSCAAGAIADTVPADAGLLVPPGDAPALAAALQGLLAQPAHRAALAEGARRAAARLPDWPQAVSRFAAVLEAQS